MQQVIHSAASTSFLNTTKLDHAVWKNTIYRLIDQQHFHEPVSDHAQCRLGKWYFEGQGAELFAHKPGFRELDGPHKRVHESGKAALHAREQGISKAWSSSSRPWKTPACRWCTASTACWKAPERASGLPLNL
ncbi:CZB domain-containing protein [Aeromonas caviae]